MRSLPTATDEYKAQPVKSLPQGFGCWSGTAGPETLRPIATVAWRSARASDPLSWSRVFRSPPMTSGDRYRKANSSWFAKATY